MQNVGGTRNTGNIGVKVPNERPVYLFKHQRVDLIYSLLGALLDTRTLDCYFLSVLTGHVNTRYAAVPAFAVIATIASVQP